jgi:hypothetical protein
MLRVLAVLLFASLAQAQHSNSLSWSPPAVTPPVVISGFNVYRAKASGAYIAGSPLAKLSANQTTYVDLGPAMKAGDVNFYVVTVVCSVCSTQESPYSAEVKAVTPADSQPPAISAPGFVIISR